MGRQYRGVTAAHSVLVAGSSQYGTFGRWRVAPLTAFDTIVTDTDLTDAAAEGIRAAVPLSSWPSPGLTRDTP